MKKYIFVFSAPIHLFFPEQCPGCRKEFLLLRSPFCPNCMQQLDGLTKQGKGRCQVCTQLLPNTKEKGCSWCTGREVFFHRHFYIWSYQKVARTLLQSAKFLRRRKSIAFLLKESSQIIDSIIVENNIQQVIYMTSSQKLVYKIRGKQQLPYYKNIFYKDKKIKNKELNRFDRFRAIDETLKLNPKQLEKIIDGNILIIDDVRTTGASLHHACKLLVEAGISKERIFTFALFQKEANATFAFQKDTELLDVA